MTDLVLRARPTTYNGIEMRSRLEARVAAWLDAEGLPWQYEPRVFAAGGNQWLPDFHIFGVRDPLGQERDWYLEVKGKLPEHEELKRLRQRMAAVYSSEPMAGVLVVSARGMETGFYLTAECQLVVLFACPYDKGNVFFAAPYWGQGGDKAIGIVTYAGRCSVDCVGVAWREGDAFDPRLCMPEWNA